MDGNGRWAKKRGLPRSAGHIMGAKTFRKICLHCNKLGVQVLTVYAFSTENWSRPKEEVDGLMRLFQDYLKDAHNYKKENIRTRFIGELGVFDETFSSLIREVEDGSREATGMTLNIAVNYGGRDELLHVCKTLAAQAVAGVLSPEQIDAARMETALYTAGQPDVDLIIRTSGERRTSNFLIWQASYAEIIFSEALWPDFSKKDLEEALAEYARRNRRFGAV